MSALPSVHLIKSAGFASCNLVGLERGRMMGRSTCLAISLTTDSVKAPARVDVPMRTWGFT